MFSYKHLFLFAFFWLLILLTASVLSPPQLISDAGVGFLDLLNFSEGGSFQYHREPSYAGGCVETRTTWWSPGQWFFTYLFTLTGMSLGVATSFTVFAATLSGIIGWVQLYRHFQFNKTIILLAGLCILPARYYVSAFQLYPGASILEFATAPWLFFIWFHLEQKAFWIRVVCLVPLMLVSYFVKSSMLLLCLGVLLSAVPLFQPKQTPWMELFALTLLFMAGKFVCDAVFTGGGLSPFNSPATWLSWQDIGKSEIIQKGLFVGAGPLSASIGLDDYVRYFFQKPGSVIFPKGHPALLIIYGTVCVLFIALIFYLVKNREAFTQRYIQLTLAITGISLAFFFYAFISGKNINAYEEARHYRVAGLLLLPLALQYAYNKLKKIVFLFPVFMFVYTSFAAYSKITAPKFVSEKHQLAISGFKANGDYQLFKDAALKSDFTYVIHSLLKFDLDPCKTFYFQDDFTSVDFIQGRPDHHMAGKTITFLLPKRFAANGKQEAILGNFKGSDELKQPSVHRKKLNEWELITVAYH